MERARQHAAATHGRQGQSRVYSSTILLSQPSYKSIEIACGISDVWAGSMYWLSSKWSEQIWYELYNCFAVIEPRSPGLVCMTHFLDLLRGGAGRMFCSFFNPLISLYIYYDQYKKYGDKK